MTGLRYILSIAAGLGLIGCLYFLLLVAHVPFIASVMVIVTFLSLLLRWFNKPTLGEQPFEMSRFAFAILVAGVMVLTNKAFYTGEKHGVWDAWAIWNLDAKYLCDIHHWKNMLLNTQLAHADYPLALPSNIAFFSRLFTSSFSIVVAYALHFLITLSIPVLIYVDTYRRSMVLAGIALLLIATNDFYLMQGLYQLADTLLALFFLCALVCMQHHKDDTRMLVLTGAFLGFAMWTKNEGAILAAIFCLFYFKELFGQYRIKHTLAGFALPLLTWLLFKLVYAPANDMVAGQGQGTMAMIQDWSRYKLIWESFTTNLNQHFKLLKWVVLIYLVICAIRRRMPDKRLLMLLTCMLVYLLVYVVSPNNLEWHLFTSLSRLMHQLTPATLYVMLTILAGDGTKTSLQARFVSVRQRLQ
ncbi:MAG: hypothetical protein EOP51_11470 [Sphingobacteriales bacterium]|nr:MAG: hypothetical protein EOP51_11470 [Sphingobacteriales bacterium]